jgi:3-dehydroquinate synthase
MSIVSVNIAERPYKIMIDQHLLMGVGEEIASHVKVGSKIAILVSKTVKRLYVDRVVRSLETSGYKPNIYLLPSGEPNKNLQTVSDMYDQLIEDNVDRSSAIIALGGGIVGDVSGFIASSLYRGIPLIQIPTTLLSQVDSSVGGKVGVNHPAGKNLIGAFYQPKMVLIDPTVLKTLDAREIVCGYGEICKYGFIRDTEFLENCISKRDDILELKNMDILSEIIQRSVEIKAEIVADDEQEAGIRMLLNFGHTVGHAIENSCGYGEFLHGEGVILGMLAALKLSVDHTGLSKEKAEKYIEKLRDIPMGNTLEKLDVEKAMIALSHDKKIRNGTLNFILLQDIAKPVIVNTITADMVRCALQWLKEIYREGV